MAGYRGQQGRKPLPTQVKVLRGTARPDRANKGEPLPPPGIALPPGWLKKRELKIWGELAPLLERMGVLTTADPHALAILCDAYAEYIAARNKVRRLGSTYQTETATGSIAHHARPEVAMAADAWRRVKMMLAEFGLTPSGRSRISVPKSSGEEDPVEKWLKDGNHSN